MGLYGAFYGLTLLSGANGTISMSSVDFLFGLPSCEIRSETVATSPQNTDRKILGVGEEVNLTFDGGDSSTTWQLEGPGTLTPAVQNALYAADDGSTGAATITATADSCKKPGTIKFTVIAPSRVVMQNPQNNYSHTQGYPDIGFDASPIYIGPDTVSFQNVFFQEVNVPVTATGIYEPINGQEHCGSGLCPGWYGTSTVVSGLGTQVNNTGTGNPGDDCVYSGLPAGISSSSKFPPGEVRVSIPWQWFLDGTSPVTFLNVVQTETLATNGTSLTASKAGAKAVGVSVGSPTGTVTCQLDDPSGARRNQQYSKR
jgi:hypothetical protein